MVEITDKYIDKEIAVVPISKVSQLYIFLRLSTVTPASQKLSKPASLLMSSEFTPATSKVAQRSAEGH